MPEQQNNTQSQKQRVSPPMDETSKTQKKAKDGATTENDKGSCGTSEGSCGTGACG